MDIMFWVWLGVIVVSAIIEFSTMQIVSIWFTFGAIIPFIMAATNSVKWEIQIAVFVVLSAIFIVSLRSLTKKFLLRNSNEKTNVESLIGHHYRMLEKTDFETVGSLKINDVVWSAIGDKGQEIDKGEIVEVVSIQGNKLTVKKIENNANEKVEEKIVNEPISKEKIVKKIESKRENQTSKSAVKTDNSNSTKKETKIEVEKKVGTANKKVSNKKENK